MTPAHRQRFLDLQATLARKPTAEPLVTPREAIAVALSMVQWVPGRLHDPDSTVVNLVMRAIDQAGWEIVAKEAKRSE